MSRSILPALLTLISLPAAAAPIRVAVLDSKVDDATAAAAGAQLADDTWFDFEVSVLDVASIDGPIGLSGFDVVVLGSSGRGSSDPIYDDLTVMAPVAAFRAAGGGVVASSWMSYEDPFSNVANIVPIEQTLATDAYCGGPTTVTVTMEHPVTDGLISFVDTSAYWETPGPALEGADVIATGCGGKPAVTVMEGSAGAGRRAYVGGTYFGILSSYNNTGLRSGDADRLFEQAVAWAAGCSDGDGDGVSACADDCDDTDPERFPGNPEVCDGIDNDCDGNVPAEELDADLDGVATCEGDCDDNDDNNFPGNDEVCDTRDNDCDDVADNGLETSDTYPDDDGDGYGDALASAVPACAVSDGFVLDNTDCDDGDGDVNPGATEVDGDGVDNDCDGTIDLDEGDDTDDEILSDGCNCASGATGGAPWLLALPLLLLLRRRR